MSVTYKPAPQVKNLGRTLIGKHHTDLADVRVEYVFRSEHAERHGHAVFGKARKVSGLNAFLMRQAEVIAAGAGDGLNWDEGTEAFFVIEIAEDIWTVLEPNQREALVDHELSHCRTKINKDNEVALYVAPHDLEEFNAVVERHGLWRRNIDAFLKAFAKSGQLSLLSELEQSPDGEDQAVTDTAVPPEPVAAHA